MAEQNRITADKKILVHGRISGFYLSKTAIYPVMVEDVIAFFQK
jgi:hypothetical protein